MIRAALVLIALAGPAAAACEFRIAAYNTSAHPVTFDVVTAQARVRASVGPVGAWGTWRRLRNGGWFATRDRIRLEPGTGVSDIYRGQQGCGHDREFRLTYACRGGPRNGSTFRAETRIGGRAGDPQPLHRRIDLGDEC